MQGVLLAYPVVGANAARGAELAEENRGPRFDAGREFTPGRGLVGAATTQSSSKYEMADAKGGYTTMVEGKGTKVGR